MCICWYYSQRKILLRSCNKRNTVQCRYNAVNFPSNIHKRHPIARPLGRGMGCLLWIQHLIDNVPQFLELFMCYLTILGRVITALDCTGNWLLPLQWRHNERDGISNHQPNACLLNRLFRRRSKKTSKFYVTSLSEGNSAMAGEFPAYRASNAENVDIIMTNFGSSIRVYHVSYLIWYIWKFLTHIFI